MVPPRHEAVQQHHKADNTASVPPNLAAHQHSRPLPVCPGLYNYDYIYAMLSLCEEDADSLLKKISGPVCNAQTI